MTNTPGFASLSCPSWLYMYGPVVVDYRHFVAANITNSYEEVKAPKNKNMQRALLMCLRKWELKMVLKLMSWEIGKFKFNKIAVYILNYIGYSYNIKIGTIDFFIMRNRLKMYCNIKGHLRHPGGR